MIVLARGVAYTVRLRTRPAVPFTIDALHLPPSAATQLVVCTLGEVRLAWPVAAVREIVRAVAITRLPGAPALVEGVIDVRGTLVPVLDLRARFGVPARPLDPSEQMVILTAGARTVACRVDRTDSIVELDPDALAEPAGLAAASRGVAGIATMSDGLVIVHDVDGFLAESEARALDEAVAAASTR
jgi:purine-binding chemotaxis protein CheW